MANKEKLNYTKTTRYKKSDMDYIEELKQQGITLRDVLAYYRENNTNEIQKLRNREKTLLKSIQELEETLEKSKEELKEVRAKLGKAPTENQTRIDVLEAKETILNNCKIKNNGKIDSKTLANYMATKEAKRVIETVMLKYGNKDKEEFMKQLNKQLNL